MLIDTFCDFTQFGLHLCVLLPLENALNCLGAVSRFAFGPRVAAGLPCNGGDCLRPLASRRLCALGEVQVLILPSDRLLIILLLEVWQSVLHELLRIFDQWALAHLRLTAVDHRLLALEHRLVARRWGLVTVVCPCRSLAWPLIKSVY